MANVARYPSRNREQGKKHIYFHIGQCIATCMELTEQDYAQSQVVEVFDTPDNATCYGCKREIRVTPGKWNN